MAKDSSSGEKRSVIITFKSKPERPDADKDKVDIVRRAISSRVEFVSTDTLAADTTSTLDDETLGFDINSFENPIVTAKLTEEEINTLRNDGNVAEVEDDGEIYALDAGSYGGAEMLVEDQPAVAAETIPSNVNQIKAPRAWCCSKGCEVRVAIADTGIDPKHPDLAPNYKDGVSFVPTEGAHSDFNGHGTHCAGTVAAAINGQGVVGVAPEAGLYGVKVLNQHGSGQFSWIIAGIEWCISHRMHVISMSLGASAGPNALESICNTAYKKGILLVAAAGNSGNASPGSSTVGVPASYESVIAVSAIDDANVIAPFSSTGPEVELCAPGVHVLSTAPGGGYQKLSGTSMACPAVSGTAALAIGSHRFSDNGTIRKLLVATADNLGIPGKDDQYGHGRVDALQATCAFRIPRPFPLPPFPIKPKP